MKKVKSEAKLKKTNTQLKDLSYTIGMPAEPNSKTQQYLGRKIRELREQKGKTQLEVAESVALDISYYAAIERGEKNPSLATIEVICKYFRVKSLAALPL